MTVVHSKSFLGEKNLWDECAKLNELGEYPLFNGRLGNLMKNDRVMALAVDNLDVDGGRGGAEVGKAFLQGLHDGLKGRLHITVGMKNPSVPPVETKDLVEAWCKGNDVEKSEGSLVEYERRTQGRTCQELLLQK